MLLKEFHVPEDKPKEMIIGVYESSGMKMLDEKPPVLRTSPEDITEQTNRRIKLADQKHQQKMIILNICQALAYLIIIVLFFFVFFQPVAHK